MFGRSAGVRHAPWPGDSGRPQVLHVATRYLRGGSEVRIADIIRSLPEADHHLLLGADSDPALARSQLEPATVRVEPALVRQAHPAKDVLAVLRLVRQLRRTPYDVLVTHQSKAGVLGRAAARRLGGPPAIHSLSMASFGSGYPRLQSALYRRVESGLVPWTAGYAVAGHDLARRYRSLGVPDGKLHVIRSRVSFPRNGSAATPPVGLRESLGLPTDRPIVLYLGSLEPRKSVLDLTPFLECLLREAHGPRPYLVVAGDGHLAHQLERDLRRAGLSQDARMLGFVPHPDDLVAAADLMVLFSRAEGLPQVLLKAAAAGTPFVAYDVDGVQELLAMGARGRAVPLDDLDGAVRAAADLLAGAGERGRLAADLSSWSAEAIADGYRGLIRTVLADERFPR